MPIRNVPFPAGLVNRTPATVRQAFWGSPTVRTELTSQPGNMNVTSILTEIIQVAGRFSERYTSDVLYDLDRIRTLVECRYDLDRDFDEIVVAAVRKDGVDGESFLMSRLKEGVRMFPGCKGPWDAFANPESTYRRILGCRVWAEAPRYGSAGRMGCELRDMTNAFLRMDRADFGPDGNLLDMPYANGNPAPIDWRTGEPAVEPASSRDRGPDGKKVCYMDVTDEDGGQAVTCTACNRKLAFGNVADPKIEVARIAMGAFQYCPHCGAPYAGCRIAGVDFEDCPPEARKKLTDGMLRPGTGAGNEKKEEP